MQGLPEPVGPAAPRRTPPPHRLAAAALVACALAAGGCGESERKEAADGRPPEPKAPASLPGDFNLQLYDCADWNRSNEAVRQYVIAKLHRLSSDQITGEGVRGRGSLLTTEQAYRMFESSCSNPRTRGFVLYKIYAFSRGFRGGRGPSQP